MIRHFYFGLEVSGAKNQKTALAILEDDPIEDRIFLRSLHDRIGPQGDPKEDEYSGDETLLSLLKESPREPGTLLGVNVAPELPPCVRCTRKHCPMPAHCTVPEVKWMRNFAARHPGRRDFTPYTQRPVELWMRHEMVPTLPKELRFEVDEALGGTRAPLTLRQNFLMRHLPAMGFETLEVWPKLLVAQLSRELELSKRALTAYRNLDEGGHARAEIVDALRTQMSLYLDERDAALVSRSLAAFEALLCAYGAILYRRNLTLKPPRGFPKRAGWVYFPK